MAALLGTTNRAYLLAGTGAALQLPADSWHAAESLPFEVEHDALRCLESIEGTLQHLSLSTSVSHFVGKLERAAVEGLYTLGLLIHRTAGEPTLERGDVESLRSQVWDLIADTRQADDAPEELRAFMLRRLHAIASALDLYEVTGALPVEDAVKATVVDAVDRPAPSAQAPTESKFWTFITRAVIIVGLANQVASLSATVVDAAPRAISLVADHVAELQAGEGDGDIIEAEVVDD